MYIYLKIQTSEQDKEPHWEINYTQFFFTKMLILYRHMSLSGECHGTWIENTAHNSQYHNRLEFYLQHSQAWRRRLPHAWLTQKPMCITALACWSQMYQVKRHRDNKLIRLPLFVFSHGTISTSWKMYAFRKPWLRNVDLQWIHHF